MSENGLSRRALLRRSAYGAAAIAAGGLLSACGASTSPTSSGSGSKSSGKKVTLTVMSQDPTPAEIAQFEAAYPNIKIEQMVYDATKLTAMISAGNAPDVVRGLGATDTPYIATFKMAAPLDGYLSGATYLKTSALDPVNNLWKFDGKTQGTGPRYGVTKDYSQDDMFWFNPAVFEKAGVTPPSTTTPISYDQWTQLAKSVASSSGGQLQTFGMNVGEGHLFARFMGIVHSLGGSLFSTDLSKVDFSSPEAQRALSWYVDYANLKCGQSLITPGPAAGPKAVFLAGRMGMFGGGYWNAGGFSGAPGAAGFRLAPAPQMGTKRESPTNSATGLWISAKSQNKDEAFQFLDFWLGGPPAKARAQAGSGMPTITAYRSQLPQNTPLTTAAYQTQQAELPYFETLSYSPYAGLPGIEALLNSTMTSGLQAGHSAGAIGDALTTAINGLLQQGKQLVS